MRRDARRRAEAKENRRSIMLPLGVGALLLVGVVAFYQIGTQVPDTDDRLCPKATGPIGATVLLLDTSDPLTPKHRAELERLAGQIASERAGRMGIDPGELLAVYVLTQNPGSPTQLIEVCRPLKNPKDRTWRDDIHQGRRFAERDWKRFEDALANAFPERASEPRSRSLQLDTYLENVAINNSRYTLSYSLIYFSIVHSYRTTGPIQMSKTCVTAPATFLPI